MWKRLIKRTLMVSLLLVGSLLGALWWVRSQTQKVPDFYAEAVAAQPVERLAESSARLEADVEQLQKDAAEFGQWKAEFATEEINAWLVEQLPLRFPMLQAKGVQDPRVMIQEDVITVAARLKDKRFDTVLSCELAPSLTDQPNCVAVSVVALRAGALPLPVSQFKDRISKSAERLQFNLRWDQRDGQMTAVFDVPNHFPDLSDKSVIIESIEVQDQQLVVAGRTGDLEEVGFQPRGPIYKIAESSDTPDVVLPIGNTMPQ